VRRGLTFAASVRGFGYDSTAAGNGYFAPRRFRLAEGSARWESRRDLGWLWSADGGLGAQTVAVNDGSVDRHLTERIGVGLTYRPVPGREVSVGYGFTNVAAPASVSAATYRAWEGSIRGVVTFPRVLPHE
jgi:hypothetical protein